MHDHHHLVAPTALATILSGLTGPFLSGAAHYLIPALIGLTFALLGRLLGPSADKLGRRLAGETSPAGERPSVPPSRPAPPASH